MTIQFFLPPGHEWSFFRLPPVLNQLGVTPKEVLHIGAHIGEEVPIYRQCGFSSIRLVEPDERSLASLRENFGSDPDVQIIAGAVTDKKTTVRGRLRLAQRTVWSGLVPHPTADLGDTQPVDLLRLPDIQGRANVLVIDTQGTELAVLKTASLASLDLVIIETTRRANDTAADFQQTVDYMALQNWKPLEEWVHDSSGYTDTVFQPCGD